MYHLKSRKNCIFCVLNIRKHCRFRFNSHVITFIPVNIPVYVFFLDHFSSKLHQFYSCLNLKKRPNLSIVYLLHLDLRPCCLKYTKNTSSDDVSMTNKLF